MLLSTPYRIIGLALTTDIAICYFAKTYFASDSPGKASLFVNIILLTAVVYQLYKLCISSRRFIK
jgi:hypothetical protein